MAGIRFSPKLFTEYPGQFRLVPLIFGLIALCLTIDHYSDGIDEEKGFFYSVVICFSISLILAVCCLIEGVMENINFIRGDSLFHTCAAILLIVISCFFIVSVDKLRGDAYAIRAAAGAFGLFFGLLCAGMGSFFFG